MSNDGRTSVLASLTKQVMDEKRTAAGKLTPVAGETVVPRTPVLPKTKQSFPNDMPEEVVEQKAAELTRIIEHLIEARDALLTLLEKPIPVGVVDLDAARKAKEAEADARVAATHEEVIVGQDENNEDVVEVVPVGTDEESFAAMQERLAKEAQAAVFKWKCPTHGKATTKTSTKTNRQFVGCPDCNAFER